MFCFFDFDPKISTKFIYSVYHLFYVSESEMNILSVSENLKFFGALLSRCFRKKSIKKLNFQSVFTSKTTS